MNYFIIDQTNPHTGEFDEHKIVTGATIKNAVEAALVYLSNYEPGWKGLGAISEATPHIFDLWLKLGNRKAPFSNSDFAEKPLHLSLVGDAAPDPSKSRHWITTETGSHILINGNGEVVAGAGGKLAGKKFSVPSGSKDVSKHIETVEKIAQAGYEKHGGDKAEYLRMGRNKGSSSFFAREYEKTGNIPEGHLRDALVDKPADNAAAKGGQNSKPAYGANNNLQANKEPATLSSPPQNEANNNNEDSIMSSQPKKRLTAAEKRAIENKKTNEKRAAMLAKKEELSNIPENMQSLKALADEHGNKNNAHAEQQPVKSWEEVMNPLIDAAKQKSFNELLDLAIKDKNNVTNEKTAALHVLQNNSVNTQYPQIRRELLGIKGAGEWVNPKSGLKEIYVPANRLKDAQNHIKKWEAEQPQTLKGNPYPVKEELKKQFGAQWNGQVWLVKAKDVEAAQKLIDDANKPKEQANQSEQKTEVKPKLVKDLTEEELIKGAKFNRDQYADEIRNPHQEELDRRYSWARNSFPPINNNFAYTIPKGANHPLAGVPLSGGELVKKDGEDMILFAGQQPLASGQDPKKYKKGDLYIRVNGKPELEKAVADFHIAEKNRQEKIKAIMNGELNDVDYVQKTIPSAKMNEGVEYDQWGEPINMRG